MTGKGYEHLEFLGITTLVVAIIGIMIAPVTCAKKRVYYRRLEIVENMKQIAAGMFIYLADNDERFMHRDQWVDQLMPILKNPAIVPCPQAVKDHPDLTGIIGHSFNSLLSEKHASELENPAAMPAIYDSINLARNASDPLTSLPNPGRHNGTNLLVYADGASRARRSGSELSDLGIHTKSP